MISLGPFSSFIIALIIGLALVPLMKRLSLNLRIVSYPRKDRWNQGTMPILGGVAIFCAFILAILVPIFYRGGSHFVNWGMLAGSVIIFGLGLYDDIRPIAPQAKLIGQIIAASMVIFQGYSTDFFSPRLENQIIAEFPNILITFVWLVGITNAINLLDNMDGLAGGIALITACFLSYFFWSSGDEALLIIAISLAGSVLGFLIYNFPPASIFMGNSGSLFIGFTLALLAIARQPQASNVFAVLAVPTLLFLLPILDTVLVTITRIMRGESAVQGGRDHTSHRLVAFGLNERQAVLVLYAIAIVSGVAAATLESIRYLYSLVIVPLLIVILAFLTAYLGRMKFIDPGNTQQAQKRISRWMYDLTYRRRMWDVLLDSVLIGIAYYLAFLTYFGTGMNDERLTLFFQTIPIALVSAYLSFFILRVYRGVWRYVGINELLVFLQAALGGSVLLLAALFTLGALGLITGGGEFTPLIPFLFGLYLFIGLAASRYSFKLLDVLSARRIQTRKQPVLIYGAGDTGEMALRWILMNPDLNYQPVGFLDDDPYLRGRQIHGVVVLGNQESLVDHIEKSKAVGVILAGIDPTSQTGQLIIEECRVMGIWVRRISMDFEIIEAGNINMPDV